MNSLTGSQVYSRTVAYLSELQIDLGAIHEVIVRIPDFVVAGLLLASLHILVESIEGEGRLSRGYVYPLRSTAGLLRYGRAKVKESVLTLIQKSGALVVPSADA